MHIPPSNPDELPLRGIRVVDFTTLLPGPLATLLLRRAGAEVIKIEPPGGEAMRTLMRDGGAAFALLNRGKRSVCADLKAPADLEATRALCSTADVVVEQFRPGVMERLGLGYDVLADGHESLVYCSITGYGREGPLRHAAGHDINYLAESGLFSLFRDTADRPAPPPVLLADVVGGAYPAYANIVLALFRRARTGRGAHLDIAMTRGLQALSVSAVAAGGRGGGTATALDGRAANYRCYPCADGQWLAVGALEDKFWHRLCERLGVPAGLARTGPDDAGAVAAIAERLALQPLDHWVRQFEGEDVCCNAVRDLSDVLAELSGDIGEALPLPLAPVFDRGEDVGAPAPGDANGEFLGPAAMPKAGS